MSQLVDKFNLDPDTAKTVIEGVAGRAYSLLLGAGASYGVDGGGRRQAKRRRGLGVGAEFSTRPRPRATR